jgi:hypothetical protein
MRAMRAAVCSLVLMVGLVAPAPAVGIATVTAELCVEELAIGRGGSTVIDPDELTARQLSRADRLLQAAGARRPYLPSKQRVVVPVYAHVLRTQAAGGVSRLRIQSQLDVMSDAFAGGQATRAARTPFRFRLAAVDVTVNAAWYRMSEGTTEEAQAKRALHRGGAGALNLYIGNSDSDVLGWATQPTRLSDRPLMDGVVIARHTMPGGSRGHYSAGDAAVHETGHWLGLFHTFAGGCGRRGDLVDDTPAEARPSYRCPVGRDTCEASGRDPVHNFMDYSYDACMSGFTDGQAARMLRSWSAFRVQGVRA